jgi:subtilisin family serine protease/subtilisin-like proprotein convertase family protein
VKPLPLANAASFSDPLGDFSQEPAGPLARRIAPEWFLEISWPGSDSPGSSQEPRTSAQPLADVAKADSLGHASPMAAHWALTSQGESLKSALATTSLDPPLVHAGNLLAADKAVPALDWIVQLAEPAIAQIGSLVQATELLGLSPGLVRKVQGLGQAGLLLVQWASIDSALHFGTRILQSPWVAAVEPNFTITVQAVPNDPLFSEQWGLHNPGGEVGLTDADIDAPEAWTRTVGSRQVVIAVVDTGIDYRHPDLASNIWVNPREIAGNGLDDDGNGFIDDLHGYDFANNDGDPQDDHGHGTHVAGIIGAVGSNAQGVTGVAWQVSLMPLKFLGASGTGSLADAVRAINYATLLRTRFGVDVRAINASWGGDTASAALESAIRAAGEAGILFVTAAGNDSRNNDSAAQYPANYNLPNLLSVAASDASDQLASFSNFGRQKVHLAAPGVNILSTAPGGRYARASGTSMAAPFVTGTVALLAATSPESSAAQIRQAILSGVDRLPGWQSLLASGGRLNARSALDALDFRVVGSQPAAKAVLQQPPSIFRVQLSAGLDPASLSPADFQVNGRPADLAQLIGSTELEFRFLPSPVSSQGPQRMEIAEGALRQAGSGRQIRAWSAVFYYDLLPGQVVTTEPPTGAVLTTPPAELLLSWNEPLDPTSVAPENVLLSEGRIVAAVARSANTVAYQLEALPRDGEVYYHLPAGSLRDSFGNPMPEYRGSFIIRDPSLLRVASADVPKPIYDLSWTRSALTISEPVTIADLDVRLDIEHPYTADLEVHLVGPDGTRTLLFADVGGAGRDFRQTFLDDQAPQPIATGTAPFPGRYRPAEPLSRFQGRLAAGTWWLELYDDALFDQGRLLSWELWITRGDELPPQVTRILPTPEVTGEMLSPVNQLTLEFSRPVLISALAAAEAIQLWEAGADGLWLTADDRRFPIHAIFPSDPTTLLSLDLPSGRLPPGQYRLLVESTAVHTTTGIPLDGDADGQPGGTFLWTFDVLPNLFYSSGRISLPIRDLQTLRSTIEVPVDFPIVDADVFLDIRHPFLADLDIFLIAPDGTRIELLTDVGGSGDDLLRTILDSDAASSITDGSSPFTGRYRPEAALAVLKARPARGTWALEITDDSRLDEGTLLEWGLLLQGPPLLPPQIVTAEADLRGQAGTGSILLSFSQQMAAASFDPRSDILQFTGPSGPIPILSAAWDNPTTLRLIFPAQTLLGEYVLELAPTLDSWLGFRLDSDGDGIPGEWPDDRLLLRFPLPWELGTIRQKIAELTFTSNSSQWWHFRPTYTGWFTAVVESSASLPFRLELYRDPLAPPIASGQGTGILRLDVPAAIAGTSYYLRLEGPAAQYRLWLVNPLETAVAGVATLHGTDEDDQLSVITGSSSWFLDWNGLSLEISWHDFPKLLLDGHSGNDRLLVRCFEPVVAQIDPLGGFAQIAGTSQPASFAIQTPSTSGTNRPVLSWQSFNHLLLQMPGGQVQFYDPTTDGVRLSTNGKIVNISSQHYKFEFAGLDLLEAWVLGPAAQARLRGGAGDDFLAASPASFLWTSGGVRVEAAGFAHLEAFAGPGGTDQASLTGSPGDDSATLSPAAALLTGERFSLRASGFSTLSVYPGSGGNDLARLFDTPADDLFTITPRYVTMQHSAGLLRVFGFPAVSLLASAGGVDLARIYDSSGEESLVLSPGFFRLQGPGYEVRGTGLERLRAFSTAGGKDRAQITGTPATDSLRARAGTVTWSGGSFDVQLQGFADVAVYGAGGDDQADLHDTPADDSLVATPEYTSFVGPNYQIRVFGFARVHAYATAGGRDVARLYPGNGSATAILTASYGSLQGSGFFARAWGFHSILSYGAPGATSTAKLYGTDGDDRLLLQGQTVALVGTFGKRYAVGSTNVQFFGFEGRNSAQILLGPQPAWVTVPFGQLILEQGPLQLRAYGLSQITILGQQGAGHRATLYDSPAEDLLEAFPDLLRLTAAQLDYQVHLQAFGQVEAISTGTADRRRIAAGVDYLMTTGQWLDE